MTVQTYSLNGTNIEDLGLGIVSASGWHDITDRSYATVLQPLRRGRRVVSTSHTVSPRTLAFRWLMQPTTAVARQAAIDTVAAQLVGLLTIRSADAPDRACYGLLDAFRLLPVEERHPFVFYDAIAEVSIICDDPLWYDVTPTTTGLTAGVPTAVAIGTGPTRKLTVTINGPVTNPVVILRDQSAMEVQRMTLTGTVVAGHTLAIDCDAYSITESTGENRLQAGWLGAGESFFELRSGYTYTLEITNASGNVSSYRSWEA